MSDNTLADLTVITEPSMTAGEAEMLLFALERSRAQFAWKAGGLDAAGLRLRLTDSSTSVAGLLKHLALVEDLKIVEWLGGPMGGPWRRADFDADPDWEWHSAAEDSPEDLYALWRGAVERSRTAWGQALAADGGLDRPADFTIESGESPNLRRGLIDLHDEYARHVGHADLLREAVDGLVGEDPPQPD